MKSINHPGYTHIALEITEAVFVYKQLEVLGIKINERVEYNGAKLFFARDPDDIAIESH